MGVDNEKKKDFCFANGGKNDFFKGQKCYNFLQVVQS